MRAQFQHRLRAEYQGQTPGEILGFQRLEDNQVVSGKFQVEFPLAAIERQLLLLDAARKYPLVNTDSVVGSQPKKEKGEKKDKADKLDAKTWEEVVVQGPSTGTGLLSSRL